MLNLLQDAIKIMMFQASDQRVQVDFSAPPEFEKIVTEADLYYVFINLIKNALQAMPQGGRLEVNCSLHDSQLEIAFQDNGAGLTPEEMDQIFEPFYSTKDEAQGLGLGLPICQKILERYNGRLVVESRPGKGTTVRVLLPYTESGVLRWPIKTFWSWMTMPWSASLSRRCSSWKATAPMRYWTGRPRWPKSRPITIR